MLNDKRKGLNMTYVFEKDTTNGMMVVEYIMSSVTNTLKVVDMTINGKYHRTSYMSPEGVSWLMGLLNKDYSERSFTSWR